MFGGLVGHIGLKGLKRRHFCPYMYHDRGKGEKSDPHLLQAQQALDYFFGITNRENEKKVSLAARAGLSFPVFTYLRPKNNCQCGTKRNVPHLLQAQQGLVCLRSISGKRTNAKSSMASSPSQLFPGGYVGV